MFIEIYVMDNDQDGNVRKSNVRTPAVLIHFVQDLNH